MSILDDDSFDTGRELRVYTARRRYASRPYKSKCSAIGKNGKPCQKIGILIVDDRLYCLGHANSVFRHGRHPKSVGDLPVKEMT